MISRISASFQTIHSLTALVVVHHNDLLAATFNKLRRLMTLQYLPLVIRMGKQRWRTLAMTCGRLPPTVSYAEFQQVLLRIKWRTGAAVEIRRAAA